MLEGWYPYRMTDWSIREGGLDDIPAVLALWRVAGSVPTPSDRSDSLATLVEHDPRALLVAESQGMLVGSLIAAWDGWRGSFHRLAVRPGHRRRGLAAGLVRMGEDRLRARGAIRLVAIVARDEEAAFEFWAAQGYTFQPDHLRFTVDDG
ncbi:MAG TPA: GNAT family N-acetyltransferase [Thermoleophilaceae bacterium]|nr:GNAT family N-acetyltransferase [Thermoleophilaceae bacterium]